MIWFKQEFLKGVGRGHGSKMVLYWGLKTEPKHIDLQFFQLSLREIEILSLFNKRWKAYCCNLAFEDATTSWFQYFAAF